MSQFLVGWVLVGFGVSGLRADGKVFPTALIAGEVSIPHQSAIVIWSKGEERLVIETRFEGRGTNFAWELSDP